MKMELCERTKLAIELAKLAGTEIKRILREEDIHTKGKGLNDVVTIADVESEKIIVNKIRKVFPEDTIISEEKGEYQMGNNEYSWAIDPLDGTMNYSRKMPYYCVSIGFMKNSHPEGGAVYIPETDELYYCEKGKGAYCNDKPIKVSATHEIGNSLTTIGFNNRYPEERIPFNKVHDECMNRMLNVEKLFSTVISLCYVAAGKIESHFELYCFLWDICVGALLVEEAGGKCSTLGEQSLDYSKVDKQIIVATNGKIHSNFESIINESFNQFPKEKEM